MDELLQHEIHFCYHNFSKNCLQYNGWTLPLYKQLLLKTNNSIKSDVTITQILFLLTLSLFTIWKVFYKQKSSKIQKVKIYFKTPDTCIFYINFMHQQKEKKNYFTYFLFLLSLYGCKFLNKDIAANSKAAFWSIFESEVSFCKTLLWGICK